MGDAWLLASQFAAAGLLLALALTLLFVKFSSRVNRAFALYLLLEGFAVLLVNVARLRDETDPGALWNRLAYYPAIVLPVALLNFLAVYRRPLDPWGVRIALGLGASALAAAMMVWHASTRCAFACLQGDGVEAGPLLAFAGLKPLLQAVVALVLVADVRRGAASVRSKAVFLVAVAFGLLAAFDAGLGVLRTIVSGPLAGLYEPGAWILVNRLLQFPALAVTLLALGMAYRTLYARSPERRKAGLLAGTLLAALASAAFIVLAPESGTRSSGTLLAGFWRTLMPTVVAYALIRHRLFGIDLKVRASVAIALVAAAFGGTYFLVSEGLEAVVSSRFGAIGGLMAAGLLALLAKPITVMARRAAAFLVPAIHLPGASGADIYRAQFLMFQEDGVLTAKERRLLDHLRSQLNVAPMQAQRIEREASLPA